MAEKAVLTRKQKMENVLSKNGIMQEITVVRSPRQY